MSGELRTERHDRTLILTLHQPERRNAFNPSMAAAGIEALNAAESNPDVRSVIITGAQGHFSAGGDVQRLWHNRQTEPQRQADSIDRFHQWIDAIRAFPKPVIAAIEGVAAGGGLALALSCDLVVAARDARCLMAYATLGLSCDGGASWHLGRQLPRALAQEWLWLGTPMPVARLHEFGLVNRVTDSGQALPEARALAESLATRAPNALASIKELVAQARNHDLSSHLAHERDAFVRNLMDPNGGEGLRAFIEKRPPRFE